MHLTQFEALVVCITQPQGGHVALPQAARFPETP